MKKILAAGILLIFPVLVAAHSEEFHLTIYGNGANASSERAAAIAKADAVEHCSGTVSEMEVTGVDRFGDGGRNPAAYIAHARAVCTVERVKHFKRH